LSSNMNVKFSAAPQVSKETGKRRSNSSPKGWNKELDRSMITQLEDSA